MAELSKRQSAENKDLRKYWAAGGGRSISTVRRVQPKQRAE
jgi:hypothetical protein